MSVLNRIKIFQLAGFTSRNWFGTKSKEKLDLCVDDVIKCTLKNDSNRIEIFEKCIKNGISPTGITSNEWIFNLSISK